MGFPPLLNLSTRLSTAALPGQTTKMAQTLESMFQNVAYRPTVYRTGAKPKNPSRHFWTECYFWECKPDQKIKINLIEKFFLL